MKNPNLPIYYSVLLKSIIIATHPTKGIFTMSQQHTKSEKRARRKRYEARVRERINEAKKNAKKK